MAHTRRNRRSRKQQYAWYTIAGVFFLASIVVLGWLGWFYWHDETGSARLMHAYRVGIKSEVVHDQPSSCGGPLSAPIETAGVDGILSIPSLGVHAPVENGASTTVLSDAVGHDPASAWPNDSGTSVLFAHDVTWFSGIDGLVPGSKVMFQDSCWTYTYAVVAHRVVPQATELLTQAQPTLYLVTCWPTNALFYTPDRYVIQTRLVGVSRSRPTHLTSNSPSTQSLYAQGVTAADSLANNPTPMG
ncbi:class D sortase, partial [Ferrimicrobium acidiphilum]